MRLIQILLIVILLLLLWGPVSNFFGVIAQHTAALQSHQQHITNIEQILSNLKPTPSTDNFSSHQR